MDYSRPLIIAGDPHGRFAAISDECLSQDPGTLILIGDQCLQRPLIIELADVISAGWDVRWILGNHDNEQAHQYDFLTADPAGFLGGVHQLHGLRIAAVSGVFKGRFWYPREGHEPPKHRSRAAYLRSVLPTERWRLHDPRLDIEIFRGLPLRARDAIFPEDVSSISGPVDVIVSHESPVTAAMGDMGFGALNALADRVGCRLWLHGHHHRSYVERVELPSGRLMTVRGLAIEECYDLRAAPEL
jgi:hypothetical protein